MKDLSILDKEIIQANPLIRARKRMNLTEMRLFALGLQDIHPHIKDDKFHDVEFPETFISYQDLIALFDNKNNGNIANLKNHIEKAYDAKIELSRNDGGFGFRHIYKKIDYIPQEGLIIQFDDEIKPYILEIINQQYTKYKVKAFFSLSSVYAWRLLECILEKQGYLRQGKSIIYTDLTIEDIRFRFNIPSGAYKGRIDNFKRKVIDDPIKEINSKTDYFVWYDTLKNGRKIIGYRFWLKIKQTEKKEIDTSVEVRENAESIGLTSPSSVMAKMREETVPMFERKVSCDEEGVTNWNDEKQKDYDRLLQYGVWVQTAKNFVDFYDHAQIERNLNGVIKDSKKGTIANIPAVIVAAIKEDIYKEIVEEQARAMEREQARKKVKSDTMQKVEKERIQKEKEKNEKLKKIRNQKSKEELISIFEQVLSEYKNNNEVLSDEMKTVLEANGIPVTDFYSYNSKMFRDFIKYIH